MSEQNMTVIASELPKRNGINSKDLIENGQNGRVLMPDVEKPESEPLVSPQR